MSTFIIRNKNTLEQWKAASGKSSWKKQNHAKSAFAHSKYVLLLDPLLDKFTSNLCRWDSLKFKDQDVYEVVELLSDSEDKLKRITTLIEDNILLLDYYSEGSLHEKCMDIIADIAKILGVEDENT